MARYSRPTKVADKLFRYCYDTNEVQYIWKPDAEMLADNVEWQEKHGRNLWDIEAGYLVIESIGLMEENWKNKEAREEYLTIWSDELDEEAACLTEQYLTYG